MVNPLQIIDWANGDYGLCGGLSSLHGDRQSRSPDLNRLASPRELQNFAHVLGAADLARVRGDRSIVHAVLRDQIELLASHADLAQRRRQIELANQIRDEIAGI